MLVHVTFAPGREHAFNLDHVAFFSPWIPPNGKSSRDQNRIGINIVGSPTSKFTTFADVSFLDAQKAFKEAGVEVLALNRMKNYGRNDWRVEPVGVLAKNIRLLDGMATQIIDWPTPLTAIRFGVPTDKASELFENALTVKETVQNICQMTGAGIRFPLREAVAARLNGDGLAGLDATA